ncbi:hypothetical protein NUW54_g8155 [Trametes sanguinea]|uniref:Uncharacterized protein n=1 Tax=Trametes sanguinea TaxID=158606 RepID=A0ACC1PIM8_9APHY|nr:hypothetical protein NUW54_g8155 [Trametes sanguinea]
MPAQPWASPAQWEWLTALRPAAQEARLSSRYTPWLNEVCHDWFLKWPERDRLFGEAKELTPEQEEAVAKAVKARRAQLGTWFNNHRGKTRGNGHKAAALPLPDTQTSKRMPHAREVWCRLHYDTHKATVESALAARRAELGRRKLTRQETLTISRREIDRLYGAESADVKAEILRVLEEERAIARATPEKTVGQERSPEQYQHAVENAPFWIERVLNPIADALGWCITVIAAGPVPEQDGDISSFAPIIHLLKQTQNFAKIVSVLWCILPKEYIPVAPDVRQKRALAQAAGSGTASAVNADGAALEPVTKKPTSPDEHHANVSMPSSAGRTPPPVTGQAPLPSAGQAPSPAASSSRPCLPLASTVARR